MDAEDRFTSLYERHDQCTWLYVLRRLSAEADPADVVAEVFTTA